jgi:hypothetical protein
MMQTKNEMILNTSSQFMLVGLNGGVLLAFTCIIQ